MSSIAEAGAGAGAGGGGVVERRGWGSSSSKVEQGGDGLGGGGGGWGGGGGGGLQGGLHGRSTLSDARAAEGEGETSSSCGGPSIVFLEDDMIVSENILSVLSDLPVKPPPDVLVGLYKL
jgi:hypothetical protein